MVRIFTLIVVGALLLAVMGLWLFGERWRLLRPSTWKFMKIVGVKRILNFTGPHGYIYGRWTNQYINALIKHIFPRLREGGKKWLSDRYHGKILIHEHAKAIVTINKEIPLRDLEQIIPYPMARDLLLKGPPDVIAYECGCRHSRINPCKPTQVCMIVGQPFTDFILEHNPQSSRRLTQRAAIALLEAEHERGHMHTAWFKDAMLGRFYVLCNCCKCCCGGIEAMMKYGIPVLAPSGYIAQADRELCTACGTCVNACPFNASFLSNEGISLDWEKCMGCGVCIGSCPAHARSLIRDERKGIPLDVRVLAQDQSAH